MEKFINSNYVELCASWDGVSILYQLANMIEAKADRNNCCDELAQKIRMNIFTACLATSYTAKSNLMLDVV